jgi:hypothetical protein
MRSALCELVGFAEGFRGTKSFAGFEDELIARRKINAMTR